MSNSATQLIGLIRRCDPGSYLTGEEIAEVLHRIPELEKEELSTDGGHLGWFYMKVKANAERYGYEFQIPRRWSNLYLDYKADLEIHKMSEPFMTIACLLRNFGLRRSFVQGKGNTNEFVR